MWNGFYRLPVPERIRLVKEHAGLDDEEAGLLGAALDPMLADRFIENAVGSFALPLGIAMHFVVDGQPVLVPMAVEESSVVAAASYAAKLAGSFTTEVMEPVTIGQVELRGAGPEAEARIEAARDRLLAQAHAEVPGMVARGGGLRDLRLRRLGDRLVVHLHVDTREAMGANTVNTLCEALGPDLADLAGARLGLRILSNLATERLATARCRIPVDRLDDAHAIVEAAAFAAADPYRAATHNKGIMNGVDPVVIASGNDWRAVEAGAHAFAAMGGQYTSLSQWRIEDDHLVGSLTLPLALGTVGGVTTLHPAARVAMKLMGSPGSRRLAGIVAAVGLAQNLAALRALSSEGIQSGHMGLHARNLALAAGLAAGPAEAVARQMVQEGRVSASRAKEIAQQRFSS